MADSWVGAGSAVAGAITGSAITLVSQFIRERRNRPILELGYTGSESPKAETTEDVYVGIYAKNSGRTQASGCRLFLERLEEVHAAGQTTHTAIREAKQLPWAGYDFDPMLIPSGLNFRGDVLRISKSNEGWGILAKLFSSEKGANNYSGTYRFHLVVTASNASAAKCAIDVTYERDWNSLRVITGEPNAR